MGESACLMHSFNNYSSSVSTEANQGNSMHALSESVSFGRFMSESLSWEKWSTFSHKRYVEEAERYAQPGSVAQKKAFFEAHYKKIAARKAAEEAAKLEQENTSNENPEQESEGESCTTSVQIPENVEGDPIANDQNMSSELEKMEEAVSETKEDDITEGSKANEELNQENVSEMAEMEKPLLKDFKSTRDASPPISKKKMSSPSSKAFVQRQKPKVPVPPPAKHIFSTHHRKENTATPITRMNLAESFNGNRSTRKTVPKIPISPAKHAVPIPNRKENDATPITRTLAESFNGNRSARKTVPKVQISPAKHAVLIPNTKENNATPNIRTTSEEPINQNRRTPNLLPKIAVSPAKSTASVNLKKDTNSTRKKWESPVLSMSMKKSAMKSLRTLIYSTPGKESDKSTVPSAKKSESSRVAPSSSQASKTCQTPSRTPLMDFTKGELKNIPAVPWSDSRRASPYRTRTPKDSPVSGSKTTRPKWHILSAVCSRPPSAHKNKLPSPTLSVPFNLKTEERAARRKQKLEEKFNEKATPKVQLQTKIKEKAETELRKLRRSLCFRARPLPEFYKEKETPKDQVKDLKIPIAHPEAAKLVRKPIFTATKSIVSPSPTLETHSMRNSDFKNVVQKAKQIPNLLTSLPERIDYENTSPNIRN